MRLPISTAEVYIPDLKFDSKVKQTIDGSSSSKTGDQDAEIPPSGTYQEWVKLAQEASPKAVAIQPVSSITGTGSLDVSPPTSVGPSTRTITTVAAEKPPIIGQPNAGGFIDSVYVDHDRQFNQKTRGMAITINSYFWNANSKSGSINVYVKRVDGSYVKSRNPGYTTRDQGILTSGVKVKIPSDNTKVSTVVYLPYPAFDLPSGKTSDLRLQVQVQSGDSSAALATDESYKFDMTSQPQIQQPEQNSPLPTANDKHGTAFLINAGVTQLS